jgi:hypothetical protein
MPGIVYSTNTPEITRYKNEEISSKTEVWESYLPEFSWDSDLLLEKFIKGFEDRNEIKKLHLERIKLPQKKNPKYQDPSYQLLQKMYQKFIENQGSEESFLRLSYEIFQLSPGVGRKYYQFFSGAKNIFELEKNIPLKHIKSLYQQDFSHHKVSFSSQCSLKIDGKSLLGTTMILPKGIPHFVRCLENTSSFLIPENQMESQYTLYSQNHISPSTLVFFPYQNSIKHHDFKIESSFFWLHWDQKTHDMEIQKVEVETLASLNSLVIPIKTAQQCDSVGDKILSFLQKN